MRAPPPAAIFNTRPAHGYGHCEEKGLGCHAGCQSLSHHWPGPNDYCHSVPRQILQDTHTTTF